MYERIYKYAFIHPPRGRYTRGEALLWALVLLVVVTMAMGVLITGMSAGNKYTDILRRQVAEQTIDNYTLAAAMQKIFGGAVTPEDFKLESITRHMYYPILQTLGLLLYEDIGGAFRMQLDSIRRIHTNTNIR